MASLAALATTVRGSFCYGPPLVVSGPVHRGEEGDGRERHGHSEQRPGDAASPPGNAEEAVLSDVAEYELSKLIE
jgi:hypothetical protein